MDELLVTGGQKLSGEITVQGAKNAALPLLCAGLMTDETLTLTNMPDLSDTQLMARLLANHGLDISFEDNVIFLWGRQILMHLMNWYRLCVPLFWCLAFIGMLWRGACLLTRGMCYRLSACGFAYQGYAISWRDC